MVCVTLTVPEVADAEAVGDAEVALGATDAVTLGEAAAVALGAAVDVAP